MVEYLHTIDGDYEAHKSEENRNWSDPAEYYPVVVVKRISEVNGPRSNPHEYKQEHVVQLRVLVVGYPYALLMVDDYGDRCECEDGYIDYKHGCAEVVLSHWAPAFTAEDRVIWIIDLFYPFRLRSAQAFIHGSRWACSR
jgi:hypothetical protein